MPGEQEHHICLYRFSIHKPIKSRLVRGCLYLPFTPYKSTTESATLRQLNSGLRVKQFFLIKAKTFLKHFFIYRVVYFCVYFFKTDQGGFCKLRHMMGDGRGSQT